MPQARLSHLAALAAGGAIGALLRVAVSLGWPSTEGAFPSATFAVNVIGALLLGALLVVVRDRMRDGERLYLFACTGILGSFTTFSTFSLEIAALAQGGDWALALAYPVASVAAGLAAAYTGMRAARLVAPAPRTETSRARERGFGGER